jgi:hypothetical protein
VKFVLRATKIRRLSRDTIQPDFPGTGQDVWGRTLSRCPEKFGSGCQSVFLFQVKQFDISNNAYEHFDLPMAVKI